MSKKGIILFLIFDVLAIGGFLVYKFMLSGKGGSKTEDYEWVTIDQYYQPLDSIEESIKNDAARLGVFPVQIRNFGRDKAILRRFAGKKLANPGVAQLRLLYPGLGDWMLVEIKYKNEKGRDVHRAVLYVMIKTEWRVADNGKVAE